MIETVSMANKMSGDVLRANVPAVEASSSSPPFNGKSHRRTSSAASDIAKAVGIDIEAVSMSEARKIMSEEHKILGFRPPTGSFAAEIQAAAARHPDGKPGAAIDTSKLKEIAREDALRILAERKTNVKDALSNETKIQGEKHAVVARHSPPNPGISFININAADARALMSHEHRALGYRPPPGSLAAEAQSAAARHPDGDGTRLDDEALRIAALRDAERIKADRELNLVGEVNISTVGKEGAAEIASAEAKALSHSPPAGSNSNTVELVEIKDAVQKEGEHLRGEQQKENVHTTGIAVNDAESAIGNVGPLTISKVDKAVETESIEEDTEPTSQGIRRPPTPIIERSESCDSVVIVGDVLE